MSIAPFHIIAADHTGITVANLERSLAFWRDVLGFELSHRPHQTGDLAREITGVPGAEISIAVLKGYGHKIELLQYLAPPDRKQADLRPCDVGSVHVALLVDDLDAVLNTIAASGWKDRKPLKVAPMLESSSFMFAIPTEQPSSSCKRRRLAEDRLPACPGRQRFQPADDDQFRYCFSLNLRNLHNLRFNEHELLCR
jgi:catechol 2,3-dioxygenase-like lactoylglutathione lyase family enzyme